MEVLRWPTWRLLESAPRNWEILMLYSLGGHADELYKAEHASLFVPWIIGLWNTGSYVINRAGMKKVRMLIVSLSTFAAPAGCRIEYSRPQRTLYAGCDCSQHKLTPSADH